MSAVQLGEHAKLIRGITFKPADKCDPQDEGAVVCMRTKNVQATLDESDLIAIPSSLVKNPEKIISAGDILVSSANSWNLVGKCCRVRELQYPSTAGGFISILRPKTKNLNSDYLYRWFSSDEIQRKLRSFGNQTTNISNLNHKRTLDLQIPLPPLAEQKRIAGILNAADALRTKRRESLAQLDTLLQSTFLDIFGDPVANPMGWARCEFGDRIEVLTDYHANGSYKVLKEHVELKNSKDFALMIRTTDLESTNFDSDNIYITREAYEFLEKSKVYGGEIIINKIGSAGNVYLMPYLDRPVSLGMNAFLIRTKSSAGNLFAYYYLTSKFGDNEIKKRVKGAVTKTIRKDAVREIPFFLPSSKALESFAAIVESVEQQKASQSAHLAELDTLFASLQSRAFRGDL